MTFPVLSGAILGVSVTTFVKQANKARWGVPRNTVHSSPEVLEIWCHCLEWVKIVIILNGCLYTGVFPLMESALYCLSVEPREGGWGRQCQRWGDVECCRGLGRACSPPQMNLALMPYPPLQPTMSFHSTRGKANFWMHSQEFCSCLPLPSLGKEV